MKLLLLALTFVLLGICPGAFAAPDVAATPQAPEPNDPHWKVRVEVLMAALPQDDFLVLLPDLRDPRKIDAAVTQILALIGRNRAMLTGYPLVQTVDGKYGRSETFFEKRYPSEFQPPQAPQTFETLSMPGNSVPQASPIPTAFETRNVGPSLEVTPIVSRSGDFIRLDVTAQRVDLLETDYVHVGFTSKWGRVEMGQPQFLAAKDTTTTSVKSGAHVLIGVHPLFKPEGYVEVFILQAVATPIH